MNHGVSDNSDFIMKPVLTVQSFIVNATMQDLLTKFARTHLTLEMPPSPAILGQSESHKEEESLCILIKTITERLLLILNQFLVLEHSIVLITLPHKLSLS